MEKTLFGSTFVVAIGLQKETCTQVWFAAIAPLKSKLPANFDLEVTI